MPPTLYNLYLDKKISGFTVTIKLKVAVVVLLNRLKASPPLTMLIIGEALLNDGSFVIIVSTLF